MKTLERTYGTLFRAFTIVLNPFKKKIITTECIVHKFINIQALEILENDGYSDASSFYSDYIEDINKGAVWADQDFKSSGHFYSPVFKKGLYGNKNAMDLAHGYYKKANKFWNAGNTEQSMFYLGAAAHLIQDMTIPQHANIRLLDNHRQYENFVKRTYRDRKQFAASRGTIYYETIEEYIRCNARTAIKVFNKLKTFIEEDEVRFHVITKFMLPLAQKTTSGFFLKFYRDIGKRKKDFV